MLTIPTEGNILLLHHWDTDGLSAAALIIRNEPADYINFSPKVGNYFLDEDDRQKIKSLDVDTTILLDMAMPEDTVDFLTSIGPVYIFDHHLQERHDVMMHHNPLIDGMSQKQYPSTTWVLTDYLGLPPDILTIFGAFGDREEKLKENEDAMEIVDQVLDHHNCTFEEILECVDLIDTMHKTNDRKGILEMPWFLSEIEHPREVLMRDDLKKNLNILKKEIRKEAEGPLREVKDGVVHKDMHSPFNIISSVARRIAWNRDDVVIVTNDGYSDGITQVYIRGPIPDSQKLIRAAKEKGFSAGGKEDVVGMVISSEEIGDLLPKMVELL